MNVASLNASHFLHLSVSTLFGFTGTSNFLMVCCSCDQSTDNFITVTFNDCHDLTTPLQFLGAELHSLSPGQQLVPLLPAEINKLELDKRAAAGVCSVVKKFISQPCHERQILILRQRVK